MRSSGLGSGFDEMFTFLYQLLVIVDEIIDLIQNMGVQNIVIRWNFDMIQSGRKISKEEVKTVIISKNQFRNFRHIKSINNVFVISPCCEENICIQG